MKSPPHTPAELSDDLRRRRAEEWRATAAGSPGSTRRRLKVTVHVAAEVLDTATKQREFWSQHRTRHAAGQDDWRLQTCS